MIEVLAALMLIGIVLPVIMQGISLSSMAAASARRRTEAAGLAESKLTELIVTGQWQGTGGLTGDFGTDWPDYRWEATVQPWTSDTTSLAIQQMDLRVIWTARGREDSLTLSTLAYARSSS